MSTTSGESPNQAPAERTTRFIARDISLAHERTMVLVTMDNGLDHTKPTTLSPAGLTNLTATLDTVEKRIAAGEVAAIAITGKPYYFAVGADLTQIAKITDRDTALHVARQGHDALRRLGELDVPSFAFVNGAAMGGGLEVALNCTYRTASSGAGALAFPECLLGIVPGWGGAYLVPRLVGVADALRLMISNPLEQNRMTTPDQALKMGLVDTMFEPVDFLEESIRWATAVLDGTVTVEREDPGLDDARTWDGAVAAARKLLDDRTGGLPPAPYRALDLIGAARTATRDDAFAAEDEAIADLILSDEFRAGLYAFDLVNRRAKKPSGAPDPTSAGRVTKVGIVGAGLMASQLAMLFARQLKVPVVMTDLDAGRVQAGVSFVRKEVEKLVARGRMGHDGAARLIGLVSGSTDKADFADAEFVIEAVFEKLSVKQEVFAQVEAVVSPECVLATNTSSLSVTEMASGLQHPERVVGFHFFNPVAVMPLVEVVRAERTDDATLSTAFVVAKALKKTAVMVKDSPSFIVNRLLGVFFGEVGKIVDAGTQPQTVDAAFRGIMPMAPFDLFDLVGPAIAMHNNESLHAAFPDRFYVSEHLERVVEAGHRYFYQRDDAGKPKTPRTLVPEVEAMMERPADAIDLESDEIRNRVLDLLSLEVSLMLQDGVVSSPADIDLAMITGAGFFFWNGGITPLLDRTGSAQRAVGRRLLPPGVASAP